MKLIESSVELLKQEPGMSGINKMIELAGRTCYKSEDKITEDSAEAFVQRMINSHHTAMLEHGTVYLKMHNPGIFGQIQPHNVYDYVYNPYCKYEGRLILEDLYIGATTYYITTNLRVLQENGWLDDLEYLCEPTEFHEKRITLRFQADIHFYKDATRHRKHSFAIESTRWINYMKEKFGMSISFMKPTWIKQEDIPELEEDCKIIENIYAKWINKGYKAEHAAYFLNQGVAATVVITAFASDWRHFFDLRYFEKTGKVHPDMLDIVTKAKNVLEENELWDYIMSFPSKFN